MSRRQIEVGILIAVIVLLAVILSPATESARHASRRSESKNNLKQLGLALYNYHDTFNGFPPGGTFHADGRPHHGWMTSILPFLDASPIYNWVNVDQPWDSTENAGIFASAIQPYHSPYVPMTVGPWEYYPAHYSANSHLTGPNSFVKLKDIPEPSSMMLVGELQAGFVPWGCPFNDRSLDAVNQGKAYGRLDRKVWNILLADGNVRELSGNISPDLLPPLSGPDLAITDKAPKKIQQPNRFTLPDDALKRRFYHTGDHMWHLDFIDKNGRIVGSKEEKGK